MITDEDLPDGKGILDKFSGFYYTADEDDE